MHPSPSATIFRRDEPPKKHSLRDCPNSTGTRPRILASFGDRLVLTATPPTVLTLHTSPQHLIWAHPSYLPCSGIEPLIHHRTARHTKLDCTGLSHALIHTSTFLQLSPSNHYLTAHSPFVTKGGAKFCQDDIARQSELSAGRSRFDVSRTTTRPTLSGLPFRRARVAWSTFSPFLLLLLLVPLARGAFQSGLLLPLPPSQPPARFPAHGLDQTRTHLRIQVQHQARRRRSVGR